MFNFQPCFFNILKILFLLIVFVLPAIVSGDCTCDAEATKNNKNDALKYKVVSIAAILFAEGKKIRTLTPEHDIFFMIKAFAAGVILATGFIHILPDAFASLTSPCLNENPWGKFPFTSSVAMISAIGTLMVDSFATGFYKRQSKQVNTVDEEMHEEHEGHVHVHTHATHGVEYGRANPFSGYITSKVLELGIVAHSVIIGISLGSSQSPRTIKPLLAALSFHQFFEGMGLGGCISQAQFKTRSAAIMATFFSLTAPVGIAIGIGISRIFDAASAGILIYMALVDLLAADFMYPRVQNNLRIQLGANASLLLGAGCMSVLAKWA
ncbi:hypothetical protein ACJW30_11G010900 [Castanea mollissima]